MKTYKTIKRYNQNFKNFNFSDLSPIADNEYLEMIIEFDSVGKVLSEIKYQQNGELEEENNYKYDVNEKLIEHHFYYVMDDARETVVMSRNEKGKLISEVKFYGTDQGARIEFEYDNEDRVIGILNYDDDSDFVSKETILYNEKGAVVSRTTNEADGKIISDFKFNYKSETEIEELSYDTDGKLISTTITIFDDKGRELTNVEKNVQGKPISSLQNIYDERGNVIEKIYKDFYNKRVKNQYDELDRLIVQEIFDTTGMVVKRNSFEYGDEGNVISEHTFEMDSNRGGRDKHFGTRYEYIS